MNTRADSFMNYYILDQNDQSKPSWALCTPVAPMPKRSKSAAIPKTVNALLGTPPPMSMRIKEKYLKACCKTCRRYDEHDIFDIGFDGEVSIKIKGDFAHSNDRVLLVSDRFLSVLQTMEAKGFEAKPLGQSGWHALRATCLVEGVEGVIKDFGERCPECGRAEYSAGIHEKLSQLVGLPTSEKTVFTTRLGWPTAFYDRDIFITEDIVVALKNAGIKGGYCTRLLLDKEWDEMKARGGDRRPRGSIIYLE